MQNLWISNHPRDFWQCQSELPEEVWKTAIARALPVLGLPDAETSVETVLALTLGEGRFGPDHWSLSFPKRTYYRLKPVLPRVLTRLLRRVYYRSSQTGGEIHWPIEARYVSFLWEALAGVLRQSPGRELLIRSLWPEGKRFALVLTHDVERKPGLEFVRQVTDLEESLGFRSSFNFVPEDYSTDLGLVNELHQRGFEVGVHGLRHDGKLFDSRPGFEQSATKINNYLHTFDAVGFRSPLTLRNPEWMQSLDIAYDLSFFDTDSFEPIAGGTMSIWPIFIGRFVELPYTLVQDYTLTDVLKESTPRVWLEKVEFIHKYCGMALINTHPDYLRAPNHLRIYREFLQTMREKEDCWKALPRDAACWWKGRASSDQVSKVVLNGGEVSVCPQGILGGSRLYHVPLDAADSTSPAGSPAAAGFKD